MRLRLFAVLALLRSVLPVFAAISCGSPGPAFVEPVERAMQLARDGDSAELAALFHTPTEYSAEKAAAETANIESALDIVFGMLGHPSNLSPVDPATVTNYKFIVGAATAKYWHKRMAIQTAYVVEFSKAGPGFVFAEVPSAEPTSLKMLEFGLPRTATNRETILDLMEAVSEDWGFSIPRDELSDQLDALERDNAPSS